MQVVFHCGVHGTDNFRVLKTLRQNQEWLQSNGVEVVMPAQHRNVFADAIGNLRGFPATPEMESTIMDAVLETDEPRRAIFSTPTFFGKPEQAFSPNGLYDRAAATMVALANLFPSAEIEFFIALKNPATLIPFAINRGEGITYEQVMQGIQPEKLRWAPTLRQIIAALPGHRIVVWCNEDTSLIWPEVIRRIATMPADVPLKAGLQVLGDILRPEGIQMIREAMENEPRLTIENRRRIFSEALEKYALPEQMETQVDLPGWDQALVDRITAAYDKDVAEIAALTGIEFITP